MITSASQTADATPVTAPPRNVEQIGNTQKTQRNVYRMSCDALYNLHESLMIHILFTALWRTQTFPSYVTIRL